MNYIDFFCSTDIHGICLLSVTLRLLLASLIGGIIGLNRSRTQHAAGFRTHILVCTGAALVMMTNQYMVDVMGYSTDPARLGAQVITGVGFLGAGTIIMRGRDDEKRIQGLTTAAGLWASACIGLTIGIGFYGAAVIGGIVLILTVTVLSKVAVNIFKVENTPAAKQYELEHADPSKVNEKKEDCIN